jgi:hypothetical protein
MLHSAKSTLLRMTFVELFYSLWINISGKALCITGTGRSRSMCRQYWCLKYGGSTLPVVGVKQLTGNTPQVALYELGYGHLQILLEGFSGAEEGCR